MVGHKRDWIWRGWRIRYAFLRSPRSQASAQPILMIHGFGSSSEQWCENFYPLSQHHPVYAVDLLGFGASQKAATAYQASVWAEQIYAFWQAFIGRPVVLVGHSLGALVAATVAATYPDMVSAVALMTLPATRQERVPSPWVQTLTGTLERLVATPLAIRLIFSIARRPSVIKTALRAAYVDGQRVTPDRVDMFVAPTGDRGAAQTLCRLTEGATQPDYSLSRVALLRRIHQPILILWGLCDRVVPADQGKVLQEQFPHIQWEFIPDANHCLYDEQAEQINERLLHWASAHSSPEN